MWFRRPIMFPSSMSSINLQPLDDLTRDMAVMAINQLHYCVVRQTDHPSTHTRTCTAIRGSCSWHEHTCFITWNEGRFAYWSRIFMHNFMSTEHNQPRSPNSRKLNKGESPVNWRRRLPRRRQEINLPSPHIGRFLTSDSLSPVKRSEDLTLRCLEITRHEIGDRQLNIWWTELIEDRTALWPCIQYSSR